MAGYWDALMQEAPAAPSLWPDANQRLENPTVPDVSPGTLSSIISGLTDPFRKFTQAHMAEYQPGVSVQDMPQTMQALPEVAMQTIGSPAAVGGVPGMGMGIRAYHGSPHDFDRFDLSKIGTGEGAQAYGHGLYFAENPKVAEEYRRSLAPKADSPHQWLADAIREAGDGGAEQWLNAKHSELARQGFGGELESSAIREAMAMLKSGRQPNPIGKMYEVNLNADPAQMLNWDSAVPKGAPVRSMIADEAMQRTGSAYADVRNAAKDVFLGAQSPELTGEGAYRSLSRLFSNPIASDALREAGIPGIKYLDQGSRNTLAGYPLAWQDQAIKLGQVQPTYNYAVFNDKIIDIMKKYGLAGALGLSGAGAMAPGFGFPTEQRQ